MSTFPTFGSVPGSGHGYESLTTDYAGLVATLSEIHSSLVFNSGKAGLGLIVADKLAPRLLKASLVERLVEETVWRRVPKHARWDKVLDAGLGATGRLLSKRSIRSSRAGAWLGGLYGLGSWLKGLNSAYEETTRLVPRLVASDAPLGRLAGWMVKDRWGVPAPMLDLGVGLVIDVGLQGISDAGMLWRGELTPGQYLGRVGVETVGSIASWWVGTAVAGAFGGPAGVAAAITVSVIYELLFKPVLYDLGGLHPRR